MKSIFLALGILASIPAAWGQTSNIEYRMVVFALRHGIRHPTPAPPDLQLYTRNRHWSSWYTTQLGCLTPNGVRIAEKLGRYYRETLVQEGLISPDQCPADKNYYIRADSFQRTYWTAQGMAQGLFPQCDATVYAINSTAYQQQVPQPAGNLDCTSENDPLFFPLESGSGAPQMDPQAALLAAAATIGANGSASTVTTNRLTEAYLTPIDVMQTATDCCQPSACPNLPQGELCRLVRLEDNMTSSTSSVSLNGPVDIGGVLSATFLMAYQDGLPMEDVAFGRLSIEQLNPTYMLNNAAFNVMYNTPYVAQAQMSNWMHQILLSLKQKALGMKLPNAVALPSNQVVLFMGHDDNLHGLGALMNVSWINKGYQPFQTPAGSGFVFTMIRNKPNGRHYVKVEYVAQTPDQQRSVSDLTQADPPSIVPLQIPGCESPSDLPYYCPLERFERLVRSSMNPKYLTKVQSLR